MSLEQIDLLLKKLSETNAPELTLKAWAAKQPVRMQKHGAALSIPDVSNLVDRSDAWHLSDYLVSSVQGGSIWFSPRKNGKAGVDKTESTKGSYPFADKQKQYRGYSDAGLDYSVKDASDAMKAMKGHDPSAENWRSEEHTSELQSL